MSLESEAKRAQVGRDIIRHKLQVQGSIDHLTLERKRMKDVMTAINSDGDFTIADRQEIKDLMTESKGKLDIISSNFDQ